MSVATQACALILGLVGGAGVYLLVVSRHSSPVSSRKSRVSLSALVLPALLGVLSAGLVVLLIGIIGLACAAGFIGATATAFLRARKRARTQRAIEECYPDLIENLISRVRSGSGLLDALANAATAAPPAISLPAKRFWAAVQVSGDASACLDQLKAEWSSPTGDVVIETIRVSHDVGGTRVVEVLRELADQVRRDRNLRREVEAKQSWVSVAARVGVAAPWVVLILLSFRSEAASAYNSPAGIALIVCGLCLSVVAYRLMISLGRTPSPQRVFAE